MNPYTIAAVGILAGGYALEVVKEILDLREVRDRPPREFEGLYDEERFARSRAYLRDTIRFTLVRDGLFTAALLVFLLLGGFGLADRIARSLASGPILVGLAFFALLGGVSLVARLPFTAYRIFGIEERYGFNRTSIGTFVADLGKGIALATVLGGGILAALLAFFEAFGRGGWVPVWIALTVVQLLLLALGPVLILPLFHRYRRVEDDAVREAVERYAGAQGFRACGVFEIDGSRRSTKANAFFTGFGRFRRIALFDTLLRDHPVEEVVAVVAHEMGHYRRRHVPKIVILSIMKSGLLLFLFSRILGNRELFDAFGVETLSTHAALVFFGILYAPIDFVLSLPLHALSRRHEYEADAFAARTLGSSGPLVEALKRLTADHLAHVTPHPLKVLLDYSHPPVLRRIQALRAG